MDLTKYFERVVLLNLPRRSDRLRRAQRILHHSNWPFKQPVIFEAVDGAVCRPPKSWLCGAGAWACAQSHIFILEQAIRDKIANVLILEDDFCLANNFRAQVAQFLQTVPDNWDGLMIGGQHIIKGNGWPMPIKPGVLRCIDCERTHCYAVGGTYMKTLCAKWKADLPTYPGHCDQMMARDLELQRSHKVYAPELFLVGQERGRSDINGMVHPRRFWNPPGRNSCVVILHAPLSVTDALRDYGIFTGYDHDSRSGIESRLAAAFQQMKTNRTAGKKLLREWIITMQWEVCGDEGFLLALQHPAASLPLVSSLSPWPVFEVTATSLSQALKMLPIKLKILRS